MSSLTYGKKTISLVKLVANLKQTERLPTEAEQEQLANWYGWGPMAKAFETNASEEWKQIGVDLILNLGELGGKRAINEAKMAITTSYFTDSYLTRAIWNIVTGLGFTGGTVLEAGCGNGLFLSQAPVPIQATGIERDPLSAMIAQYRLPSARILNKRLQDVALERQSFDLAIGNVPFANVAITDEENKQVKLSLHNYFLLRGLRALRPGGLLAAITSRYTLDAEDMAQRHYLMRYGDFLGAIRLPEGAHKAAYTDVISDVLLFQRREVNTKANTKPWSLLSPDVVPGLKLNEYFKHYPERILGEATMGHGQYANDELVLKKPANLEMAVNGTVEHILEEALKDGIAYVPHKDLTKIDEELVDLREDGQIEGSFYLVGERLVQIVKGLQKPVPQYRAQIAGLVKIKEAAVALLDAEQNLETPDATLTPLRDQLNYAYDTYRAEHGAILRSRLIENQEDEDGEKVTVRRLTGELQAFKRDYHFTTLVGLVDYDDKTGEEKKADIFFRRIHMKPTPRTSARDISEAMAISLDQYGYLHLEFMAELLGTVPNNIPSLLGDLAYEEPYTGKWLEAGAYLSGHVRRKLAEARRAVEQFGPRFQRNVDALEPVIPIDLLPEEIHGELGVTWVETTDIAQFALELINVKVAVTYEPVSAAWTIVKPLMYTPRAADTSTWGTKRMDMLKLLEHGLNKRTPVVWDSDSDGNRWKNADETIAAQDKLREISERFTDWLWEEPERAKRLTARYNEIFRSEVARTYDGSFLTFPDMNPTWAARMYPWQKGFIARMIASRSALCVHPVGAGKTMSMIAGAMKLRQLGFVNRVGIVVPNHLLEQIASEARRLYPKARILMIGREDLTKERKGIFAARVAVGEYDMVVLTHSSLYALGMHPETERAFLEEKLTLYRQVLLSAEAQDDGSDRKPRTMKALEKKILRMEEKQAQLLKKEVNGVTFEQLGISCIFLDECQMHKNLGLPSNTDGFQVESSKRAIDLEMKIRWLERHTQGPFAAFFSATPWSNNMVEAYVMAWYLSQQRLFDYGLDSVDAFIANFIEISNQVEVSADGSTFQNKQRPRSFFNVPDLIDMLNQFADIQPDSILNAKRPQIEEHTIAIDPTPEMLAFVSGLVDRARDIHNNMRNWVNGHEDNMLCVVHEGRELAVSPRQVGITTGPSVKVEAVAAKVYEIWQKCQNLPAKLPGEHQSLQIIFCDIGTPNAEKGEQVYGEIKRELIQFGMPEKAIRYIHEAKNDTEKADLFRRCRAGEVAVLLGSTEKLGTGTNIQDRCVAIHIAAPPWRPDMIAQCIGRAHRPGNMYQKVHIYRYVCKRTFDAYMWQTLERKAHFMAQLLSGNITSREVDAQSEMELSFAEVKAAATGDPLILEQAATDMEAARLQRLARTFFQARERDRKEARYACSMAETLRTMATTNEYLNKRIARASIKGFKDVDGIYYEDRQKIGLYLTQRVFDFLMQGARGKRLVGYWSGIELYLLVNGSMDKDFAVELIIGYTGEEQAATIRVQKWWLGSIGGTKEGETAVPQQWRFAHAIEEFFTRVEYLPAEQFAKANVYDQEAAVFEVQATQSFPQEQTLRDIIARKIALDAYTALVASEKSDAAEIESQRAYLLKGATQDYSQKLEQTSNQEEVFALNIIPAPETVAGEAEVTTPLELPAINETLPVVMEAISKAFEEEIPVEVEKTTLEVMTEAAVETVAALSMDQLLAVSLFDDIAPKVVSPTTKKGGQRKKATSQKQLVLW